LWWVFFAVYLTVSLYAASSTLNLNSGATPGLARYALWYLPLTFPFFYATISLFRRVALAPILAGALAICLTIPVLGSSYPSLPEMYDRPSAVSHFIQRYLPWSYNPPPEIFAERYGRSGERKVDTAVLGPDCRKVLLRVPESEEILAWSQPECMIDNGRLARFADKRTDGVKRARYVRLSDKQAKAMRLD
jgi:hypothetical protein